MAGGVNAEINDAWKNPKERELKVKYLYGKLVSAKMDGCMEKSQGTGIERR